MKIQQNQLRSILVSRPTEKNIPIIEYLSGEAVDLGPSGQDVNDKARQTFAKLRVQDFAGTSAEPRVTKAINSCANAAMQIAGTRPDCGEFEHVVTGLGREEAEVVADVLASRGFDVEPVASGNTYVIKIRIAP